MEEWKDIIGYPGYRVSSAGNIWSNKIKRVINPPLDKDGYKRISLWKNGERKRKNYRIHRLVALHFIPNSDNKPTVNHIDGDKTNNHISNLEWATMAEQNRHKICVLKPNKIKNIVTV